MSNQEEEDNKITISSNSRYHEASMRFRDEWNEYQEKEGIVKFEIVNMVKILEKEGLNRTQSIQKIIDDHSDLKGFSRRTIYRELPDEMKQSRIYDDKKLSDTISVPFGTDEEDSNETDITEDDFKKREYTSNPLEEEEEGEGKGEETTEEEPEVIYDPKIIDNYVKKIAKLEEENTKLKIERIPTRAKKSDFKYEIEFTDEMFLLIRENSGICPLIGTHFCDKDDGYFRFDKAQILEAIKKTQKAKAK